MSRKYAFRVRVVSNDSVATHTISAATLAEAKELAKKQYGPSVFVTSLLH
jgi:hypothetical protein